MNYLDPKSDSVKKLLHKKTLRWVAIGRQDGLLKIIGEFGVNTGYMVILQSLLKCYEVDWYDAKKAWEHNMGKTFGELESTINQVIKT